MKKMKKRKKRFSVNNLSIIFDKEAVKINNFIAKRLAVLARKIKANK